MVRRIFCIKFLVLVALFLFCVFCAGASADGTYNLPESLQTIEDEAFYGDTSIGYVSLPDGIQSIGAKAFADSSLQYISCPPSLTYIAEDAFDGCNELVGIGATDSYACRFFDEHGLPFLRTEFVDGVIGLESLDGRNYTLLYFGEEQDIVLPSLAYLGKESISITDNSFRNDIRSLVIPEGITSIESFSFWGYELLEEITFPDSLTQIGDYAFFGCHSLSEVYLPQNLTSLDWGVFRYCTSLNKVVLPDTLIRINSEAFWDCHRLTDIVIPDTVEFIGPQAFLNCNDLPAINLPEGLKSIEEDCFRLCDALTVVVLPSTVETIGSRAFADSPSKTVYLPETITWIADDAFADCGEVIGYGESGTYAQQWFEDHGYEYIVPEEDPHSVYEWEVLNDNEIRITKYTGSRTEVSIPDSLDEYTVTEIGQEAFAWNELMSALYIPGTVRAIGNDAFRNCVNLKEINFHTGLISIGEGAFSGDVSLIGIALPDGIESIGALAFANSSVMEIYLPASITFIADNAFENISVTGMGLAGTYAQQWFEDHGFEYVVFTTPVEDFEWEYNSTGVTITGYTGTASLVVIPTMIEDEPITEIGNQAFMGNSTLSIVMIPDSVEMIGKYAFSASSLLSVSIPKSVVTIDEFAFYQCTSLRSVAFSEGLDAINTSAFQECTALQSVDLPESLTYLGWRSFRGCSSLSHFGYPVGITEVGGVFLYDCPSLKTVTVPEGVYKLMDFFVANAGSVETVNLPSTLEVIGKYSFAYDNAFTTIVLPESVEKIDEHAFYQCYNLETIELPEHLDRIEESAFQECTGLTSIDLPESLTYLGWRSFRDCSSLTHFGYPVGIREVGGVFLSGCTSLTEVTVPEGVTRLMDFFISNASAVTTVSLPSTLKEIGYRSFACGNAGAEGQWKTITLPEGLEIIGEGAFAGSTNLISIDIPGSVTYMGIKAFDGASGLRTLTLHDGLKTIETYAFRNCSSLRTVTLPNTVETLGCAVFENCTALTTFNSSINWNKVFVPGSFSGLAGELGGPRGIFVGCTKLTAVTIPEGTICIPRYAFYDTPNLATVTLPSTIKKIDHGAFMSSAKLRTINFPDGLTEIGFGAFRDCSSLRAADLPDSVTTIGCEAFRNCINITSIHYPRNWTTAISPSFYGDTWDMIMFATDGNYNFFGGDYKIVSVEIPDGVPGIITCAFQNCTGLQSVIVPDSVTEIQSKAFENCSLLPKVYISPNVTKLGENIFDGCEVLTVWCEYGSTILEYCIDNNIPYYYLTPDGVNSPSGTLYLGDSYNLHGYARASIPLESVTATIWNSDKSEVLQTITVTPEVGDYDLSETVNYNLEFSTLPLGQYHFSLVASTELSEEIWADNAFKIAEPPLRVSISSFAFPTVLAENADGPANLTGEVYSNYTITSLHVQIVNVDGTSFFSQVYSPSSKQYSLSNVSLTGLQLPAGNYKLQIYITAKDENKKIKDFAFGIAGEAVVSSISEDTRGEIEAYLLGHRAGTFAASSLVTDYIQNNKDTMTNYMYYTDMLDISLDFLEDLLGARDYSSYMVKRYEKEMADLIKQLNSNGSNVYQQFSAFGQAKDFADGIKDFYKVQGSYDKITLEKFSKDLDAMIKNGTLSNNELLKTAKEMKDASEEIGSLFKTVGYTETGINMICSLFENHGADLAMLDYIEEYYDVSTNPEMRQALKNLRTQYSKEYGTALHTLFDKIKSKVRDEGIDLITEAIFGDGLLGLKIKLLDTCIKLLLKYSGATEKADNYWTLLIRCDALNTMSKGFEKLCSDYKASVQSGHALTAKQGAALLTAFTNARLALVRLYEIMEEVDSGNTAEYYGLKLEAQGLFMPGVELMAGTSVGGGGGSVGGGGFFGGGSR